MAKRKRMMTRKVTRPLGSSSKTVKIKKKPFAAIDEGLEVQRKGRVARARAQARKRKKDLYEQG